MPLHKLWNTIEPKPGIFDTIIIDEASQAGIDSLILLFLTKNIIIVGDDKQNSPEAVGIREDDLTRLKNEYLKSFIFSDEFRPDTSLFDHAQRAFGNIISLREHFRCVPEIIQFSNNLFYRDMPLIPLRQPPPNRLPPLINSYISDGVCEGEGQYIINRREAEELVNNILNCIKDPRYKNKSMGVIVLQGHAQAQLIEKLLAEKLEPKIIYERKIRCGIPSTFQGDERDIIFLSLVIANNVHYRALNRINDQRRFNVAMSRARDQVWLFHSVKQSDLSPDDLRRKLISYFENPFKEKIFKIKKEIERLESAILYSQRKMGDQPEPYESWFEVDVALELLKKGYKIYPQYEVAGKRIDIVIEGDHDRLAIECDGDFWHGPEQYEKDMIRQRQLERVGWKFCRIRASEFYSNKDNTIEGIITLCDKYNIKPISYN